MPCKEEAREDIDVALQILDAVTPRINIEPEYAEVREITQTDHLNQKLLKSLLNRLNVMAHPLASNSMEQNSDSQDFD